MNVWGGRSVPTWLCPIPTWLLFERGPPPAWAPPSCPCWSGTKETPFHRQSSSNLPYPMPGQDPPGKGGCPVMSQAGGGWGSSISLMTSRLTGGPTGRPRKQAFQGILAGSSGTDGLGPAVGLRGGWPDMKHTATGQAHPRGHNSRALTWGRDPTARFPWSAAVCCPLRRNPQTDGPKKGQGPGLPANPEASYSEKGQSL